MNEKTATFQLLEPPLPEALVPHSWVEPWMIAVAVIGAALIAFLIFRKKKAAATNPLSLRQAAYTKAVSSLEKITTTNARDATVQCSLILRSYLSAAVCDPMLFETHEETLSRHDSLKGFSDTARLAAQHEFSRLASLKYAAEIPDADAQEVIKDSRALLETLHHGFQS
jgi:hypothetical protein